MLHGVVNGERDRLSNAIRDQLFSSVTVHPSDLDLRLASSIRPNGPAYLRVYDYGGWDFQADCDQTSTVSTVSFRDHHSSEQRRTRGIDLCPVEIAGNPIYG